MSKDFPVVWDDPSDAERTWRIDRLHRPDPVAPLDFWFSREVIGLAIVATGRAGARLERRINTYVYTSSDPAPPLDEAAFQRSADVVLRVRELWEDEIFPEVDANLRWWASVDLPSLSDESLLAHLDETIERAKRVWVLHFMITAPSFGAIGELTDLCLEVCGGTELDAFKLVQGFGNKTIETGRELWRLSRLLREHGEVPGAELEAFLLAYGRRSNGFGLAGPSWIEESSPVLETIRRFAEQEADPYANLEQLAAEREAAVAAARERFASASQEARARFEALLPAAQAGIVITEDHGFYIDFASKHEVRRVFVEAGRRLAERGLLEDPSDIVMLEFEEIIGGLRGPTEGHLPELVRARREEMERFADVHPPEFLGARPPDGPPKEDPQSRFIRRFMGPTDGGVADGVLRGAAGAPGRARGTARLVLDLGEADRLAAGEILVTRTTTPAWTPLFAVAAAVVTDGGGALSHCAIVAREYGIPAVVGTMTGTVTIADGQTIEVDGNEGTVRLVS